jgi:hypothetical protein
MNQLRLKHDYEESAAPLEGEFTEATDVDVSLDTDTTILGPDGRLQAILLCGVIPRTDHLLAYELLKDVDGDVSNRPKAVGVEATYRSKSPRGEWSSRQGVNEDYVKQLRKEGARQGILGYLDGSPACRKTRLTDDHPEMLDGNRNMIELMDSLYAQHAPEFYDMQKAEVEKAGPNWRHWDTAFTTIYVIKQLKDASYHRDSGNLPGALTAITPCGDFTGGELVLLRWRIAIAYKPGDLLLFDPSQLHGNLTFVGERLSAACYCEQHIAKCGTS